MRNLVLIVALLSVSSGAAFAKPSARFEPHLAAGERFERGHVADNEKFDNLGKADQRIAAGLSGAIRATLGTQKEPTRIDLAPYVGGYGTQGEGLRTITSMAKSAVGANVRIYGSDVGVIYRGEVPVAIIGKNNPGTFNPGTY